MEWEVETTSAVENKLFNHEVSRNEQSGFCLGKRSPREDCCEETEVLAQNRDEIVSEDEQADTKYFNLRYPESRYDELTPGGRVLLTEQRLISFDPADHIDWVPTEDEFIWDTYKTLPPYMSRYEIARIEKRLQVSYRDLYGSVEQQALLYKQRRWPKDRVYNMSPGAIRARKYRRNLDEIGIGGYSELVEQARVRMQAVRAARNTPAVQKIKAEKKETKRLARATAKADYMKAKRLAEKNLKKDNASNVVPKA